MTSILESVIGSDRYAAMMRGEDVTMAGDEVTRFKLRMDRAKEAQICQSPCLFRNAE